MEHQGQRKKRKYSMLEQISTLQPHGGPNVAAGTRVLREVAAHGKSTLEQRKRVKRKEWQRGTVMIATPSSPLPLARLGRVGRRQGVRMEERC